MDDPKQIRFWDFSEEERQALAWFSVHSEPPPDPKAFAALVAKGLLMQGNQGSLCRTVPGQDAYEEMISWQRKHPGLSVPKQPARPDDPTSPENSK